MQSIQMKMIGMTFQEQLILWNPSIRRWSVPDTVCNVKSVSLRPLIEHFYLEDKRHTIIQVMLMSQYNTILKKLLQKTPEKVTQLKIPAGKKSIGTH